MTREIDRHGETRDCYDLIIRGGEIMDGSGAPARIGDVAVSADRIMAVGDLADCVANDEIDASGLVLAPGFVDVHTHDDRLLLDDPSAAPKASQGVTTVVVGNCGVSIAPFDGPGDPPPPLNLLLKSEGRRFARVVDYFDALDRSPAAINCAVLVGHTTLRAQAMGNDLDRAADAAEIGRMRDLLAESITAGAIGLSSGLFYPPAQAAPASEVAAVAEVMASAGGILTSHIRDEGDQVMEAIDEAVSIAEWAGVRLQISHHKAVGRANFGRSRETLVRIDEIRERHAVGIDAYPYVAGSTVLLPHLAANSERVLITWSTALPAMAGRDLASIAAELGCDQQEACTRLQPAGAIYFSMSEEDVQRILGHPRTMIGSDGIPGDAHPHPRLWGTFPRVLGHYARDLGIFPLEEAVHRMSGLPAAQFGLTDRGVIRAGAFADLVLFDRAEIADRATFEDPERPSAGIVCVYVNGSPVWRNGGATGQRPGRALRRAPNTGAAAVAD